MSPSYGILAPTLVASTSSTGNTPILPVPPPLPGTRLALPTVPTPRVVSDPTRPPPPYQRVDTPDPFNPPVSASHASARTSPALDAAGPTNLIPAQEDFERHGDFWFGDGSVVLLCGRVGFRVHTGLLRMHCTAFRELLSPTFAPPPVTQATSKERMGSMTDGHETIEGCPVLRLADAPEDVALFLRALYDRGFLQDKRSFSLFSLGGVLTLARAYGAHSLRAELSRFLQNVYPTDLATYMALYCTSSGPTDQDTSGNTKLPRDAHPLLALEIATRACLPVIVPTALLRSTRVPLAEIFDGFALEDGRRVRIGKETVRLVVEFRERMNGATEDVLRRHVLQTRDCQAGMCEGLSAETVRTVEAALRLHGLEARTREAARTENVCTDCLGVIVEWEKDIFARIWRVVPISAGETGGWDAVIRMPEY